VLGLGCGICFPSQQRITCCREDSGHWWQQASVVQQLFWYSPDLLLVLRAVPEPIWALIFLFVLFPGFYQERSRLLSHNLGIMGRLMAEVTKI